MFKFLKRLWLYILGKGEVVISDDVLPKIVRVRVGDVVSYTGAHYNVDHDLFDEFPVRKMIDSFYSINNKTIFKNSTCPKADILQMPMTEKIYLKFGLFRPSIFGFYDTSVFLIYAGTPTNVTKIWSYLQKKLCAVKHYKSHNHLKI
jgi:hypothetical protein